MGEQQRTWGLRGREAEVAYWKKVEDACEAIGGKHEVAERAYLPKHAKEPGKRDAAIEVADLDGDMRRVAVTSHKRLRRRVGYVLGSDGRLYELRSAAWLLLLLLLLVAAIAAAGVQLAVRPDTSPLVTGGIVPVETVQVTSPEEVGQIKIPGYNDFEVSDDTKVALSNPSENTAYLFKYTVTAGGKVVHETPYWIEPGKADMWQAAVDLAAWRGEKVDVTIAISVVKAGSQQACNGAQQTVSVEVR